MKRIYVSALWALVSIPISLVGVKLSFWLARSGGILLVFYSPFLLFSWIVGGDEGIPEWLYNTLALSSQYFGYFLII